MPWPTVPVVTTGMDADTDTLPRSDILDHAQKFNQLIAMRAVADGVCDLDGSGLIPSARLPAVYQPVDAQLTTLAGITAQQATDLAALSTFMGTALNDVDGPAVRETLGAEPTLLVSYTVPTATTSVVFSGLDILTHKGYRIEVELVNGAAAGANIGMYINGLTTATDYYNQYISAANAVVTSGRTNDAEIMYVDASSRGFAEINLSAANGFAMATSNAVRGYGSTITLLDYRWSKSASVTNVTSLTFSTATASGIGASSIFRIFRGDK